jgi:hypothetical protein
MIGCGPRPPGSYSQSESSKSGVGPLRVTVAGPGVAEVTQVLSVVKADAHAHIRRRSLSHWHPSRLQLAAAQLLLLTSAEESVN